MTRAEKIEAAGFWVCGWARAHDKYRKGRLAVPKGSKRRIMHAKGSIARDGMFDAIDRLRAALALPPCLCPDPSVADGGACPECRGSGSWPGTGDVCKCQRCGGTGREK